MKIIFRYISIIIFCLYSCNNNSANKEIDTSGSLYKIRHQNKLRVVMDYNSINYFIYKGRTMGFQYDLAKKFVEYLNIRQKDNQKISLEISVCNNLKESFNMLRSDSCDILTTSLTKTPERLKMFEFSNSIAETHVVLVQNKNQNTKDFISNIDELKNKTIFVKSNTAYEYILNNLNKTKSLKIRVVGLDNFDTEDLIKMVSTKEIMYNIADENIAYINSQYYKNIDVSTQISEKVNLCWAMKKGDLELKHELNKWLNEFKKTSKYSLIYNKYYKSRRAVNIFNSSYYYLNSGKISDYDDYLKIKSKEINWDWKLLASLIYQESKFDPKAESWVGAYGLMQIMPETAYMLKMDSFQNPKDNINTGIKYLKYLTRTFKKELKDTSDIKQFILASYNVGPGHVFDARRLANKYGRNPDKWYDNTDFFLLNKSKPLYYKDNLSRNGYCRGEEPYNYVEEIMERYLNYINIKKH